MTPLRLVATACICLLLSTPQLRGQVVGADSFAARSLLTGTSATGTATNVSATAETNEPAHVGQAAAKSVWWRWVAPSNGIVEISTAGSTATGGGQFVSRLSVYTGTTLAGLTRVAANLQTATAANYASVVRFVAVQNTSYAIAVDGYTASDTGVTETGTISLTLTKPAPGTPPTNDNFAAATIVAPASATASGDTTYASVEAGEPDPQIAQTLLGPARSVWYSWTPLTTGNYTLQVDASTAGWDVSAAVYTGNTISALTLVDKAETLSFASGEADYNVVSATFTATAGTPYRIQISGDPSYTEQGAFTLTVQAAQRPNNDDFASATDLGTSSKTFSTSTLLEGTRQTNEPNHFTNAGLGLEYSSSTIWFKWTAPAAGTLTVDTRGSDGDTVLAVYRAASTPALGTLTFIAANDDIHYDVGAVDSAVTFTAVNGAVYYFAVAGYTQSSLVKLHLAMGARLTPYNAWLLEYPSLTGNNALRTADPDGDGFTNLQELFLGMDPTVNAWTSDTERAKAPRYSIETNDLFLDIGFSFANLNGLAEGNGNGGTPITITAEESPDLKTWTAAPSSDAVFGSEAAYVTTTLPTTGQKYLRFRVNDDNP